MINAEDDCSVGESVKMRGRWLDEEQRRRATEKLRLLKEEESRIAKMKAKLDRRKKKEERRKRDRERMERGNRELVMNREMFTGEESFFDIQPVNSSTQKTVMFNKELTKIRNISPVESENLIEIVEKIENKITLHEHDDSDDLVLNQSVNEIVSIKADSEKVIDKNNVFPLSVESQQVFLPTQPATKSRRKVRKSPKVEGNDRRLLFNYLGVKGFDAKQGVQSLLFSDQLNPCQFSLPKEFTSLKLEKIRENKILNQSFDLSSQSLLSKSMKRKRQISENDDQFSPKRRVKSSHIIRRLERTPCKDNRKIRSDKIQETGIEVKNVLFEKCSDGQFSVIVCISANNMNVWVSNLSVETSWIKVGHFVFEKQLLNPFLIVDTDTIRIKSFCPENNQIKETSFVILGDDGDFSDSVTSTQNVLVLTETVSIDNIVVEKYDSKQVVVFHNLDKYSRGSIVNYNAEQMEVKFLATIQGCTQAVKKLNGTEKIFLTFLKNIIYFWDIKLGICIKTISNDEVDIDHHRIVKVVNVFGIINIFHLIDEKMTILALRKGGYKELATYSLKEPLPTKFERNSSCLLFMNYENLCLVLGNLCLNWNLKDKLIECDKIANPEDFHSFLPFTT